MEQDRWLTRHRLLEGIAGAFGATANPTGLCSGGNQQQCVLRIRHQDTLVLK
jgi:hypothetical protein